METRIWHCAKRKAWWYYKDNILHYTQTKRQTSQLSLNKPTNPQAKHLCSLQIASECLNLNYHTLDFMNILLVLLSGSHTHCRIHIFDALILEQTLFVYCNYSKPDIRLDESFVSLSHLSVWEAEQRDKRHPKPNTKSQKWLANATKRGDYPHREAWNNCHRRQRHCSKLDLVAIRTGFWCNDLHQEPIAFSVKHKGHSSCQLLQPI